MLPYLKYKNYYDCKASTAPLKINDYCYSLNPKADNQSTKFAFPDCIWTGPYIAKQLLSINNYTIPKIGTRYTQTLHRIRICPFVPKQRISDVTVRSNQNLLDPDVKVSHNERYATSWKMDFGEQIDKHTTSEVTTEAEQPTTLEITHTDHAATTQHEEKSTIEYTDNTAPTSPNFSFLTTDVADNRKNVAPHPLIVHVFRHDLGVQSLDIIREKQRNIRCDLILNIMLTLTSNNMTHLTKKK